MMFLFLCRMSDVYEGYERQYCELSVSLSGKCSALALLDGGICEDMIFSCNCFSGCFVS